MDVPVWTKKARASVNKEFISIKTYSGYRLSVADYEAEEFLLEPDASDETIGSAIVKSLSQSRFLTLDEARRRQGRATELYDIWVKSIMERYSYKTKRAMFKGMKSCGIYLIADQIKISPTRHDTVGGWEHLGSSADVLVPAEASAAKIGAALRLAFNRCI